MEALKVTPDGWRQCIRIVGAKDMYVCSCYILFSFSDIQSEFLHLQVIEHYLRSVYCVPDLRAAVSDTDVALIRTFMATWMQKLVEVVVIQLGMF